MSLIAKFAAKKAAASSPTVEAVVAETAQIHMPTVETNTTPAPAPKRTYTRKAAEVVTPVTPPVVAPTPATRAISVFDPFSIITGQGAEDASSVLEMIMAKTEETGEGFDGPFPLVKLLKGNSGGSWTFGSNVDGEAAGVLPVAKNPFTAIFLGYRIYGVAWETSKMGHASTGGDDAKAKPIWKLQIASADKDLVQLAINAGETYQFMKGHPQNDPRAHIPGTKDDCDGIGHFRPGVEMLFYRKGIVFAVRLPDHYSTTIKSLESLGSVMRGVGGLRAIPVVVTPYSTDEKGAVAWKCHAIRVDVAVTAEGKALAAEFESIKADLIADAEFGPTFQAWNTSGVEDGVVEALKEICALKKAR